ncbi:MAG TPA: glutamate--tRNA ligase [Gemmatimonadaceae bacterium]|nr:glutamate--tRNA ligase [Gemmatimonadaceae bacterium]
MPDPLAPPRVRFAPSPTGYLHVGGARTALFNWLYARQTGGAFLLRVEDTDKARSTDESERAIFEGLEWLGLNWDEHVVHQALGLPRHQRDANFLLETGAAYRCFCTQAELEAMRQAATARKDSFKYDRRCDLLAPEEIMRRVESGMPFSVRFRVPEGETAWDDEVHGRIAFPNKDIEDFVILRSDGTPIYNLAVVSDDIDMGITLVMRGDDHISNTPKQIQLYRALGNEPPRFAHVPMIHGMDGKKLSKRHGATAVADYQNEGILPGAMVNFLALMGWSPGGDREVMSLEEMIALFSLAGLQKKAAIFDTKKLEWMNGQHLSRASAMELEPRLTPALIKAGVATAEMLESRREWYLELIDLLKVRSRTVLDMVRQAAPFFPAAIAYDPAAVDKQWSDREASLAILHAVQDKLAKVDVWTPQSLEAALRALAEERGVAAGKIFQPLRVALTGLTVSPGIFEVLVAMGPELTMQRLRDAYDFLKAVAA